MLAQDNVHPSQLYMELAAIAGRLATYGASARRLGEMPAYDHIDPQAAFGELADTLRSLVLSLRHGIYGASLCVSVGDSQNPPAQMRVGQEMQSELH